MKSCVRFVSAVLSFIAVATVALAAVPQYISYQGRLNDQGGAPVNGTVSLTFSLYSALVGGSPLWTETQALIVSNGVFSVQLGTASALPTNILLAQNELFLGVRAGADQEMIPRQRITSGDFSQVTGDQIAREAVWPVHEGRNNTIVSYFAENGGTQVTSFVMPVDKKFIVTDINHGPSASPDTSWVSSCGLRYVLAGQTKELYKSVVYDLADASNYEYGRGKSVSLRSGIPVPAGATLEIYSFYANAAHKTACTVSGFEIPATP